MVKIGNIPGAHVEFHDIIKPVDVEHKPFLITAARRDVKVSSPQGPRVCVVFDIEIEGGEERALFLSQNDQRLAVADYFIANPQETAVCTLHKQALDQQRSFWHICDWDDLDAFIASLEKPDDVIDVGLDDEEEMPF